MAYAPQGQREASSPAARHVPVTVRVADAGNADDTFPARSGRMARFAAGVRWAVGRLLGACVLLAAGWLLAVAFGLPGTAPAAADTTAAAGADGLPVPGPAASGAVTRADVFPAGGDRLSTTPNAEAMAGRSVDGLTSQSTPTLPAPSNVGHDSGANGFVPQGGGGPGLSGPGAADVTRFVYDPRPMAQRAPMACVLPPVVRTAADDPSISPD
ncbi:hypothetical protein GCM10017673_48280 [Streptosporangium violaceochromogenes]|nr:hypothetical protein GCM10017673_48280 [Streptosporangium violaceochromogenes]